MHGPRAGLIGFDVAPDRANLFVPPRPNHLASCTQLFSEQTLRHGFSLHGDDMRILLKDGFVAVHRTIQQNLLQNMKCRSLLRRRFR